MSRRQRFSAPVAREIAERDRNASGFPCCANCGAVRVPLELHHLNMDAAVPAHVKKAKPLTAADGAMWCKDGCHKAETKRQRALLAKIERQEGVYWRPRKEPTMQGRGFAARAPKDRALTKVVARRPIYEGA